MKLSFVILLFLLLTSAFFSIAIAQENETSSDSDDILYEEGIIEETDILEPDVVEILEEDEIEESIPEYEEDIADIPEDIKEAERRAFYKITHVTIGNGFVMKEDESNAVFFRGMWLVTRIIEKPVDLKDAEMAKIESKKFGFIVLGSGENKQRYRIEIKSFDDESAEFDVKTIEGETIGTLLLNPKRYETLTLWFGNLKLDSGNYPGEWRVTAISRTKIIKPKIKKPPVWNIFAFKSRKEAAIKERLQERVFEREGLGDFIKEKANQDFKKMGKIERRRIVNTKTKLEKRLADKEKTGELKGNIGRIRKAIEKKSINENRKEDPIYILGKQKRLDN